MQPSLNLKSFLAVLIILIVPTALLVAYFRNYSAEGGSHEHGSVAASGKDGDMSAKKPDHDMSTMRLGSDKRAMKPDHDMSAKKPDGDMGAMKPSGDMSAMAKSSAMPGVPGVSRLYHIGATGFFLNHPEHITITIKQRAALNGRKRKALLSKATAQRNIEEAEQELWELTSADKPDAAQIQATVQAIEKLRGEQRMAFIQSVGEAAEVLTDEQSKFLLGTAAPVIPDSE